MFSSATFTSLSAPGSGSCNSCIRSCVAPVPRDTWQPPLRQIYDLNGGIQPDQIHTDTGLWSRCVLSHWITKKEEEKVTPVSFTCFISEKRERSLCIPSSNQLFYKYNNNEYSTNKWQNQNYKHTTLRQAQCPIS